MWLRLQGWRKVDHTYWKNNETLEYKYSYRCRKRNIPMKRLERSMEDKMFLGVCSGFGEYTDTDPTIWRLAFIVGTFLCPPLVIAYFIFAFVMPKS